MTCADLTYCYCVSVFSLALLGEYSATVTGSNQVSDLTSERFNFTVKEAISGQIRVNSTDGETSVLTHTTLGGYSATSISQNYCFTKN